MSQNSALRKDLSQTERVNNPIELEGFLPYRLSILATEISQNFAHIYGDKFNLSIPEWRVLATLGQFGTVTARDICKHSRMHKTTVSRAVATMEKRGLLALRTNLNDMREVFLSMSEEGKRIYFEIVPMALQFEDRLCHSLTAEERALFEKVVTRLLQQMKDLADS